MERVAGTAMRGGGGDAAGVAVRGGVGGGERMLVAARQGWWWWMPRTHRSGALDVHKAFVRASQSGGRAREEADVAAGLYTLFAVVRPSARSGVGTPCGHGAIKWAAVASQALRGEDELTFAERGGNGVVGAKRAEGESVSGTTACVAAAYLGLKVEAGGMRRCGNYGYPIRTRHGYPTSYRG
uniref:Uncharacterized protein n=1 Tax=Oryza sativa subsp. japonica TaxID=39947 RepID=Q6Z853_ORYSJ|nr:hypothetical protein [Oryza sativa Japonica Group]